MSHDKFLEASGSGYTPQTFKANKTNWLDRFNAYNSDEMQKVSTYFSNVVSAMEDANEAIESSGIEGISKINLAFDYSDTKALEEKRENLSDFSAGVYDDADELIEDPFYARMYKLMRSTQEHRTMPVTYMGNTIEIPFEYSTPENIFTWMMSSVTNTDIDDILYTGDERKDAIIREYMTYDMRTGTYGFEKALENWDNLNPYRQGILAHCYEYSYRQYEMVMDDGAYGAKEKHDIVQRMANKFIEHKDHGPYSPYVNDKYVEVSAAGKGMSSYLGENSRGKKFVDDLNTKTFMPGDFSIVLSHEGAATVFRMGGKDSKTNTATSPYQFYAFVDNTLSYCTSQQRSVGYVFHEAEKNPGLYAHQKELGLSLQGVADILTAAKNQTDMEILEKLSTNTGNYYSVFTKNADLLSDQANDKILEYVVAIQGRYRETESFIYEREVSAIDSFYGDAESPYSQGYWNRYFDLAKEYMTQEELVDIWTTPGYKMTDAELEKAKIIARDELDKFEYRTAHDPILKTQEDRETYARYLSLMNKCSKVASASTGIMAPFVSISDFACDGAEDILGTAAEIGATSFDEIAGTDTLSSVLKLRQDYAKYSDEFMESVKREQMNAETQNPKYYIGGKVVGNMLLYTVTSPIFKGMASALGVESGLGLFFANQAAQNVQDLILDTRNLYDELTIDGELSDADKTKLKWNVGINGAMNVAFGFGDLYKLYKGAKVAKETDALLDAYMVAEQSENSSIKDISEETGKEILDKLSKSDTEDGVEDIIRNTGTSATGTKLTGEALLANNIFRGDNFKAIDSFNNSVDAAKRNWVVDTNAKITCVLDENLDGVLRDNPSYVTDIEKSKISELRNSVPIIDCNTVMQKVITRSQYEQYMNFGKDSVGGCVTRACDAAPYIGNGKQAYENLRLDYSGTPYKEIVSTNDEIFIIRYKSYDPPKNTDIPRLDPVYGPPCTESGFVGGKRYLIPEYQAKYTPIKEAAIFELSADGIENIVCYWSSINHSFIPVK